MFTGLTYRGGTTILLHRDLDTIPVLAPAGAILPLAAGERHRTNPDALELRVYAGADGEFSSPRIRTTSAGPSPGSRSRGDELRIHPVEGEHDSVPATRRYDVVLCGFADVTRRRGRRHRAADRPGPGAAAA